MKISEILNADTDEIVTIWADQAQRVPAAQGLTREQVVDSLQDFLRVLAVYLAHPSDKSALQKAEHIAALHVAGRIQAGFNLDEVVHEYTFLGESVSRIWSRCTSETRPDPEETERFFTTLNAAISTAVSTYNRHLGQDEQDQKRYVRLLDRIATQAFAEAAVPFHQRLDEVLGVLQLAAKADSVTLLLFDAASQDLTVAASTGVFGEYAGEYSTTLESGSFAGAVAATEDSLVYLEKFKDEVDVSEALRQSPIKVLLGHPLRCRGQLVGVLYFRN